MSGKSVSVLESPFKENATPRSLGSLTSRDSDHPVRAQAEPAHK